MSSSTVPPSLARVSPGTGTQFPAPGLPRSQTFEWVSLAGRGTFADVWQIRDRQTGRLQALKQLRPDQEGHKAARRILENEAEIGGKIESGNVVKVGHAHFEANPPYLLMEWLTGKTLAARLAAQTRLFCREALWIARQCAQGMHALLISGYIHGDIKPSNIFLCDDGIVKLIDLGFARADRQNASGVVDVSQRTLAGTPDYLAPEALVPGDPGGISRDVYSLGVTLYQMLTGSLPFKGETVVEVLRQHQQALPPRLRSTAPDVPREVNDFVHRLLSKQPWRRNAGLSWLVHELIGLELSLLPDCS